MNRRASLSLVMTAILAASSLSIVGPNVAAMAAAQPPAAGPQGVWLDQSGRAGIDIKPCGDKLCGNIVWLKVPLNAEGKPKLDIHNSDANLQKRPLCGLPLLWNFSPDGDNAWSDGQIYDPEKGETYSSNMHLKPDGTLSVRGYIGISLLGRSQIWTRAPANLGHC